MANLLRGGCAALLAFLTLLLAAGSAGASTPDAPAPLGGAVLHHLPAGLGTSTDFEYRFTRVSFAARVWESGSDADGWRVDLQIDVMHGRRLTTARAFHDWFVRYEQRPPAEAHYVRILIHGRVGWAGWDQIFWLERPGVAVSVQLDRSRWPWWQLFRTARGVRLPVAPAT